MTETELAGKSQNTKTEPCGIVMIIALIILSWSFKGSEIGFSNWHKKRLKSFIKLQPFQLFVVAGDGIEPPTRGFSILCSTD